MRSRSCLKSRWWSRRTAANCSLLQDRVRTGVLIWIGMTGIGGRPKMPFTETVSSPSPTQPRECPLGSVKPAAAFVFLAQTILPRLAQVHIPSLNHADANRSTHSQTVSERRYGKCPESSYSPARRWSCYETLVRAADHHSPSIDYKNRFSIRGCAASACSCSLVQVDCSRTTQPEMPGVP